MQLFHFGASRQFPAAAAKTIWSMISACTLQVSLLFPDTDLSILSMAHHYLWNWMELFSVILWRGVTFLISIFHISSFRDRLPLINCWRFLFVLFLFCFVIVIIFFFYLSILSCAILKAEGSWLSSASSNKGCLGGMSIPVAILPSHTNDDHL